MPALRAGAYDWPWGPAVAAVAVVAVAVVPVGSVCTIITHRRCLATQSIRRLGRSARRTNINLTALRASQCSTEGGASSSAALDARRARRGQPLPVRGRLTTEQWHNALRSSSSQRDRPISVEVHATRCTEASIY